MSLNSKPRKEVAYAALGLPVIWVAHSTLGEWPETGVTMSFDGEDEIISFAPTSFSVDGMDALWNLTAEQIATLDGITSWRIQVNGAWPLMAGFLSWGSGWTGVGEPQILGSVIVGPQGATGPSAYEAAVTAGFLGTEEEWAAGLVADRLAAVAAADRADAAANRARGMIVSSVRASYDPISDPEILTLSIPVAMIDPDDPHILRLPVEVMP